MDLNFETSNGEKYVLPASENHYNHVRRTITQYDHPNPILIIIIVIMLLLVLWYIRIKTTKLNLSGHWYDKNGDLIDIHHCPWSDDIIVNTKKLGKLTGNVDGSGIYLHSPFKHANAPLLYTGVYKDNEIYWNNGDVWKLVIHMY
jgi:hypothetical protein